MARHEEAFRTAQEVLIRIPALLSQYADCEKLVVRMGRARLFSVDCIGDRLPD